MIMSRHKCKTHQTNKIMAFVCSSAGFDSSCLAQSIWTYNYTSFCWISVSGNLLQDDGLHEIAIIVWPTQLSI